MMDHPRRSRAFLGVASALLINAEVRRRTLLVRQQTLEGEIDQTLKEVARLHMEFGDMLVKLTKDYRKVEHDKWVKDTNAVMENWQTQLSQARANWEKANNQVLANRELVSPVLRERLKTAGDILQVDETGLDLAKDLLAGGWDKNVYCAPKTGPQNRFS